MVIGIEDIESGNLQDENGYLSLGKLAQRVVDLILTRERHYEKKYGTVVIAEGLAEKLPPEQLSRHGQG